MPENKQHILLIEDAEPDVFLVREALRQAGIASELKVLDDGEKAVDFIDELDENFGTPCPDLVLLDLNLPKRSGDQILQHMRRSGRCGQVPVIVVTSSDSPKDREQTSRLGATLYFRKPSRLDEFMKLGPLVGEILKREAGA
jgi:two-component system, chemotaxis family, response regulator Rcp1